MSLFSWNSSYSSLSLCRVKFTHVRNALRREGAFWSLCQSLLKSMPEDSLSGHMVIQYYPIFFQHFRSAADFGKQIRFACLYIHIFCFNNWPQALIKHHQFTDYFVSILNSVMNITRTNRTWIRSKLIKDTWAIRSSLSPKSKLVEL